MKILEEISNIIKHKLNGELIDNKKYLKTKIISTQKKPFNVLIYQSYWLIQFIEKMKTIIIKWRRNFSLVARYSLKFTCSFLLVAIAKYAHYLLQKLLVAKYHSLLVAEVARCKKSFVTCCKIRLLLIAEVARCKESLATRCRCCM